MSLLTTCQNAAEAVGIEYPTAVAGATDDQGRRLKRLAINVARELARRHNWAALLKEGTVSGSGAENYALPSDYARGVPGSEWDRTQHTKLRGDVSSAVWQTFNSGFVGSSSISRMFKFRASFGSKQIFFEPVLPSGTTIYFDYISKNIFDDGMGAQTDDWSNDGYTCLIDEHLIELGLVYQLKRSIGENHNSEYADFERAFNALAGQDAPGETLYLGSEQMILAAVTPETIPVP